MVMVWQNTLGVRLRLDQPVTALETARATQKAIC